MWSVFLFVKETPFHGIPKYNETISPRSFHIIYGGPNILARFLVLFKFMRVCAYILFFFYIVPVRYLYLARDFVNTSWTVPKLEITIVWGPVRGVGCRTIYTHSLDLNLEKWCAPSLGRRTSSCEVGSRWVQCKLQQSCTHRRYYLLYRGMAKNYFTTMLE